ncbi:MAG: hypothetical protein NTY03_12950 [Candidatus Bathyarchaeota archaeon]|nr:hypothetical protein [Candidatus Bathyarchaeota archaeon]
MNSFNLFSSTRNYAIQNKSIRLDSGYDKGNRRRTKVRIMENRRLKGKEADELIIQLLREAGRPLTTREVQEENQKKLVWCPDSTIVFSK